MPPQEEHTASNPGVTGDIEIGEMDFITENDDKSENTTTHEGLEDASDDKEQIRARRRACYTKLCVGLLLAGFIIFVVTDSLTNSHLKKGINTFLEWIKENTVAGVFLFMLAYFVATILFIPGAILTLGAGFIFASAFSLGAGIALGTIAVFVGASLGAVASFLLGWYLLREQAIKLTEKYALFEAIDAALQDNGFKIFCLLRLSPIIPFNIINYIGGVSSVSFRDYALALFAILPGTVLYVFVGASAESLRDSVSSDDDRTVTIVVVVIGLVFGIIAILLTARYAKKELNRIVGERRSEIEAHEELPRPSDGNEEEFQSEATSSEDASGNELSTADEEHVDAYSE